MATASLDTVGFCPGPAQKANRGASDLLEGQLFAYGCGSGVVVVEVQQLQVAATLEGVVHKGGAVTAVKWCPMCHSRDLISDTHLRLASGDSNGSVAVWDVQCQSVCATLDDALLAVTGNNAPKLGVVHGLEWVTAKPFLLAVLMAPATLLVWDTQGDVILWQRELTSSVPEPFVAMCQDPLDRRRLCVSGPGHLAIITLTDVASDDVAVKQFKLETRGTGGKADTLRGSAGVSVAGSSAGMQAVFASTRGLLFVLLPREIQALDMELGVPATSRTLPSGRAPFVALLGVYGRGVSHGGGDEGGSDCCYALHADGSLTIWLRMPGELRYTLSCASRLMPPISRNAAQSSLLAVRAQVWKHDVAVDELVRRPWLGSTEEVTSKLQSLLLPDSAAETAPGADREGGSAFARTGNAAKSRSAAAAAATKPTQLPTAPGANTSRQSLLIMSVTSDGKVWQWDAPLPRFSDRSFITSVADTPLVSISGSMQPSSHQPPPPAAAPMLVGMLHTLPHAVTTLNLFPKLLATGKRTSMPAPPHSNHLGLPPLSPHLLPKPRTCTPGGGPTAAATAAGAAPGEAAAVRAAAGAAAAAAAAATVAAGVGAKAGSQDYGTSLDQGKSAGAQGGGPFGSGGDGGGGSNSGEIVEVALMGAAVTAAGNVELFTMTRGQASPLAAEVAVSLNVHRNAVVRGVRWLGSTPRLVSFTVERVQVSAQQAGAALAAQEAEGAHSPSLTAWRNVLAITDVRSRRSMHFREVPPEPHPLLGLRASPSGAHLLLLIKGAPAELWRVDTDKPARLRLLDLPFTAVEWVQPAEVLTSHMTSVDDVADWHQQQHRQGSSQHHNGAGSDDGWQCTGHFTSHPPHQQTSQPQQQDMAGGVSNTQSSSSGMGTSAPSSGSGTTGTPVGFGVTGGGEVIVDERLAFTLGDGRAGVLSVCGRHVADARAKRPVSSNGQPMDAVATAIAAWGHTVVLGDSWGQLGVWDTLTGKTTTMPTGFGTVRRILVAPAPHPSLYTTPDPAPPIRLRLACLFSGGQFGVYELDATGHIRAGHASPLTCTRVGRVLDLAWLNLPWLGQSGAPSTGGTNSSNGNGSGCVLAVVTETGSIALLDVSQASDRRPSFCQRMARLNSLLSYPLPMRPSYHHTLRPSPFNPGNVPLSNKPSGSALGSGGGTAGPGSSSQAQHPIYEGNLWGVASTPKAEPCAQVYACLAPPRPVGSALLLWRPWALLLRLLLQLGVSQECLLCCCSSRAGGGAAAGGRHRRGRHQPQPLHQKQQPFQQQQQQRQQQRALQHEQRLQDQQWHPWQPEHPSASAQQQAEAQGQEEQMHDAAELEAEAYEVQQELLGLMPQAVHEALFQAIDPSLHAPSSHPTPYPCLSSPVGSPSGTPGSVFGAPDSSIGHGSAGSRSGTVGPTPSASTSSLNFGGGGGMGVGAEASVLSSSPQGSIAQRRAESAAAKAASATSSAASKVGGPILRRLSSNSGHSSRATDARPHGRHHQGGTGGWEAKQQLQGSFQGDLLGLIAHLGRSRAQGRLLHPEEWRAYLHTLAHHSDPLHPSQCLSPKPPTHHHPNPKPSFTQLCPASHIPQTPQHQPPPSHTSHTPSTSSHPHTQPPPTIASSNAGMSGSVSEDHASATASAFASVPAPTATPAPTAAEAGSDACSLYGRGFRGGVVGISQRMAVAAKVSGDAAEARFWKHLPSTLQAVVELRDALAMGVARAARKSGATPPGAHANSDSSGSGNIGSSDSSMKDTSNPRGASLRTEGSSGSIPADILTGSHNHHHHHHHQHHANHYHHSPGASRPAPGRAQPVSGVVGAAEAEGADAEEGPLPPPPLKHPPSSGLLAAEDEDDPPTQQPDQPFPPTSAHHHHHHHPHHHNHRHHHQPRQQQQKQQQHSAHGGHAHKSGSHAHDGSEGPLRQAPRGLAVKLWDEDLTLAEAQEHTMWHEALSRAVFEEDEALQEKRMLEYVVLGDFQTAVAFLLASTPEKSARYYRDALVTTALAAAANARPEATTQRLMGAPMQIKAAKVVSAHASSVGDTLLAVPLHCSAGLYAEAVGVLQECGLWRYAAHLTAHALTGVERAESLHRWAQYVLRAEGNTWGATGILVAAGCLREALQVLLEAGLPDCAAAFFAACQAAGLTSPPHGGPQTSTAAMGTTHSSPADVPAAQTTPLPHHPNQQQQQQQQQQQDSSAAVLHVQDSAALPHSSNTTAAAPPTTPIILLDPLQGLQLYSVLASRGAGGGGGVDAAHVQRQFEAYVVGLLAHI